LDEQKEEIIVGELRWAFWD